MDRRMKRSRQKLHESLLTLLDKKPIEKITVKELCQLADINRSTFYQYYDNPPHMLAQIQGEITAQLKSYLTEKGDLPTTDKLLSITRYLYSQKQYMKILLYSDAASSLLYVVYDHEMAQWKVKFPHMPASQRNYLVSFLTHGGKGIIVDWMAGGYQESPDYIAQLIKTLCNNTLLKEI